MTTRHNSINANLLPNRFLYLILSSVVLFSSFIFFYIENLKLLSITLIILNLLSLLKFNKSLPLFILFFYIAIFSQPIFNFSFFSKQISFWTDFQNTKTLLQVCFIQVLFLFSIFNTINRNINYSSFKLFGTKNSILSFLLFIMCVLILIFGLRGENIFQSGSYANNENVEKSPIHEYFIIFFLLFRIFMPVNKLSKFIYLSLFSIYIIKTLIYGGRIEVVEISLLVLFIDVIPKYNIKTSRIIIGLLILFYFNLIINNIRSNPLSLVNGEFLQLLNPINTNNDFESTTQGDVIQSSARMIGLINYEIVDFSFRITSFISYLSSTFFISDIFNATPNLAKFKQDIYQSGGGGLISSYFYFWLSYSGPVIIGLILGSIINCAYINKYYYLYVFTLLISFPRWVAYNPIFLLKFCLFGVIIFFICRNIFFNKLTNS
jgi:hypothetical protein